MGAMKDYPLFLSWFEKCFVEENNLLLPQLSNFMLLPYLIKTFKMKIPERKMNRKGISKYSASELKSFQLSK